MSNKNDKSYTERVRCHYARNYKNPIIARQQNQDKSYSVEELRHLKLSPRENTEEEDLLVRKQSTIEPLLSNETGTTTADDATMTTTSSVLYSVPGAIHVSGINSSIDTARIMEHEEEEITPIASATIKARDFHEGDYERIEISIKCRDLKNKDWLSKSDPFCVVHLATEGDAHYVHHDVSSDRYGRDDEEHVQVSKIPPEGSNELGRTEVIKDNLNPNFTKTFTTNFIFEEKQTIIIRVYDEDVQNDDDLNKHDYIGYAVVTLAKLISCRGHCIKLPLLKSASKKKKKSGINRRGYVILQAEKMISCNDQLILTIVASDLSSTNRNGSSVTPTFDCFKKNFSASSSTSSNNSRPRPFLLLSRKNPSGNYTAVWESHVIENRDIIPAWSTHMTLQRICNGDLDRPLCFEIFDWEKNGSHRNIGSAQTTARQLLTLPALSIIDDNNFSNSSSASAAGKLEIKRADLLEIPSMIEYTSGTCQINFMAAVDFSSSNNFLMKCYDCGTLSSYGNNNSNESSSLPLKYHFKLPSESLHFFNDCGFPNEYQAALSNIGSILRDYGTNCQAFPLYGFGGNIHSESDNNHETSHCFKVPAAPCVDYAYKDDEYEHDDGLSSILDAYRNIFREPTFEMTQKTHLAPIIREAAKNARELTAENEQAYTCCLILTDGKIDDIDQAIDTLVEVAASSPLSIIIVGVGGGDFSDMERLDGDDGAKGRLVSSTGEVCARDLVQFVPFRKYSTTMSHLTAETLTEIPFQLVNYFMSKGIKPSPEVPIADVTY